jgi:hypothetical protein
LGLIVGAGCSKEPDTPMADSVPPPPARPTTRDLIEGARADMPINSAPLTVKVPPSWKIELVDGVSILEGPTPSGDTTITVSTLPGMTPKHIDLMADGAKADAQQHPNLVQFRDLHQINGLRVFEKIEYSQAATQPATQPDQAAGPPPDATSDLTASAAADGPTITWSRLVFVPFQDSFLPCSFSISAMTPDEYNQDQAFLQSVLDSAQARVVSDLQ